MKIGWKSVFLWIKAGTIHAISEKKQNKNTRIIEIFLKSCIFLDIIQKKN